MHKSVNSINILKAHVVSFFSYLTSVPRTFDLHCTSGYQVAELMLLDIRGFLGPVYSRHGRRSEGLE